MQGDTLAYRITLQCMVIHFSEPMHSAARCRAIAGVYPNYDFYSHASSCIPMYRAVNFGDACYGIQVQYLLTTEQ
jgi:hypothetical protein